MTAVRCVIACALLLAASEFPGAAAVEPVPSVVVSEQKGIYTVAAAFSVPQPSSIVMSVLRDYEAIPRFMPDVKSSRVIERGDGRALVEQDGVARLLMFSRRIQLLLEIDERRPGRISFTDRSGKSFHRYEGAWQVRDRDGSVFIDYGAVAQPAFDVPAFALKRLLKRDATRMIASLRTEIAARAGKPLR